MTPEETIIYEIQLITTKLRELKRSLVSKNTESKQMDFVSHPHLGHVVDELVTITKDIENITYQKPVNKKRR